MDLQLNGMHNGKEEIVIKSSSVPIVVLLHGALVNRKMWLPHLNLLSPDFNIIAPDLPGHGSLSKIPFTLKDSVERVMELIKDLNNWPVILIGDSLGGYVAIAIASKYPNKFSALILSGCTQNYTGILGTLLRINTKIAQWIIRAFGEKGLANITKKKLQKNIDSEIVDEIFDETIRISSRIEALKEVTNRKFSSYLASFDKPVLFINGEKDWMNRWGEKNFIEKVAKAKLKIVHNTNHLLALTQPEKYVEAIRSFLEKENINVEKS